MLWAPGSVWKVFKLVRAIFEQFGAGPVSWGGLTALGLLSRILLFSAFPCCIAAFVQGECALAQGKLAYVQEELFVVFELWFGGLRSLFEHGFVSDVSSCCPFLRVRDLSSSSDLALRLSLAFDRLLRFLFICFFSLSFLSGYFMWVLSIHSSRGRLRTMRGSRTGGWSLPCVMSD
jgi:hypothetical protein